LGYSGPARQGPDRPGDLQHSDAVVEYFALGRGEGWKPRAREDGLDQLAEKHHASHEVLPLKLSHRRSDRPVAQTEWHRTVAQAPRGGHLPQPARSARCSGDEIIGYRSNRADSMSTARA
jgi:hypothetical protein